MKQYGSEGDDSAVRITHDEGGLIVAGYTNGLFGEQVYGDYDVAVLKTDFNGEPIWKAQWGTEGNESAYGLTIASDGAILLSGRIDQASWDQRPNDQGDAFIMQLSSEGERI